MLPLRWACEKLLLEISFNQVLGVLDDTAKKFRFCDVQKECSQDRPSDEHYFGLGCVNLFWNKFQVQEI